MNSKNINGKWYIEVFTKEFGNVLLLDNSGLPVAIEFITEKEALDYIKYLNNVTENRTDNNS